MQHEYKIHVFLNRHSFFRGNYWAAIDDNTYDGQETDPVGYGETAAEAVEDLIRQIDEKNS